MEIKEIFTFYGPSKSPTTTTTYIHTTKDSLAPLFYLQQCSSRWANPPCYRVIELLMDFVSSYQKEIRQIFAIKQKYYQTAGFWVLLHSHLSSFFQKGWDDRELLKPKGQTKSKWFFRAKVSSKKWIKEFYFTTMEPQVDLFSFVFWRKLKTPKRLFEINWPLPG